MIHNKKKIFYINTNFSKKSDCTTTLLNQTWKSRNRNTLVGSTSSNLQQHNENIMPCKAERH